MPCHTTIIMHSLFDNKIGDDGAVGLGEGLGKNTSLTNNIGDVGAAALVCALEKNTSLEVISLDEHKISAGILARIPARIELRNNESRDAGKAAVEALKANKKVRWGRAKLMVVGKGAAGKTSTIRTLLDQPISHINIEECTYAF
ncbi:Nucleotide-binding oligomerization domain-containing protein 2 [Hondaea fermentalgiana]|uniref:Nucleotide-binding oligomerization domain-containing protein 2 n=1 Tax=Hondaea fermentalgiana TaxID=2315210 RepID=A0A2R5GWL9_9STRA|nr:Nucleotide-binding oligomerization domain-containing protein 2 [Hondaea fermentalgiana]|eukprot:GBG35236.1 Nucleotide-binding oligomerization domain-containing protein 2 [Hondaea fermentalgiana]